MKTLTILSTAAIVTVASAARIPIPHHTLSLTSNDVPTSTSMVVPALEPSGPLIGVTTAQVAVPTSPEEQEAGEEGLIGKRKERASKFRERVLHGDHKLPFSKHNGKDQDNKTAAATARPRPKIAAREHEDDKHEEEFKHQSRTIPRGLVNHSFGHKTATVPKFTFTTPTPTLRPEPIPTGATAQQQVQARDDNKSKNQDDDDDDVEDDDQEIITVVIEGKTMSLPWAGGFDASPRDKGIVLPTDNGVLTGTVIKDGHSITTPIGWLPTLVAKRCEGLPAETATITSTSFVTSTQGAHDDQLHKRCDPYATSLESTTTTVTSTTVVASPSPTPPPPDLEAVSEDTIIVYAGDDVLYIPLHGGSVSVTDLHDEPGRPANTAVSATVVQNGISVTVHNSQLASLLPLGKNIPFRTNTTDTTTPCTTTEAAAERRDVAGEARPPLETGEPHNVHGQHLTMKPFTSLTITDLPMDTPAPTFATSTRRHSHKVETDSRHHVKPEGKVGVFSK